MGYEISRYMFLIAYKKYTLLEPGNTTAYFSPFFRYGHIDFKDWYAGGLFIDTQINTYKLGVTVGYQQAILKHFILDWYAGPYLKYNDNTSGSIIDWYNMPWENGLFYKTAFLPGIRVGLNLGIAF
jgi:hypothetical protein